MYFNYSKSIARSSLTILLSLFSLVMIARTPQNVKYDNTPLKVVLQEITAATDYTFAYSDEVSDKRIVISGTFNLTEPIENLMKKLLAGKQISFKVIGKQVILATKDVEKSAKEVVKRTVSGVVKDDSGQILPGATIKNENSGEFTITDVNGAFSIKVNTGDKLTFTFVGLNNETVIIDNRAKYEVMMTTDTQILQDVVVIGYGNTQKVKDLTGSISHMGEKEIKQATIGTTVQSMLQGRAAGVNVQIQSASPTSPVSVIIRGQSSLSGDNQPLWVIDGIPEYNAGVSGSISNVLYSLNLNDVESIDILKDASSTAIYGSRAANGVIVVTTRSGREGMRPTLEFSSKVGYQLLNMNGYDYFTSKEYIAFTQAATRHELASRGTCDYFTRMYLDEAAFKALNTSEINPWNVPDLSTAYYNSDTYWLGEMTRNPFQQQYDLSLRGGTTTTSYLAGISYNDVQGVVKGGYSRFFSGRVRLESKVSDKLRFRVNVTGNTRNASDKDSMLDIIKKIRPDIPVYNEDGTYFTRDYYTQNPYILLENTDYATGENISGLIELQYTFIPGFFFSTKGSINYANTSSLTYNRERTSVVNSRTWSNSKSDTKIWDNTLSYSKIIGKHDISANVTASMEKYQSIYYSMYATGFPDDDVLNSFSDASSYGSMGESTGASTMVSQIARAQYKYADKYLATFTIRHDGSSKFGPGRQWGWFPSGGLGWTISEEPWMKEGWVGRNLSFLKLRASYGKSGSQNLSNYQWMTMVGSINYNENPGIYPSSLGNDKLQWEESYMTDIALEVEFLDSRLRGSFGYFDKKTDNLIYSMTLPSSSAFTSIYSNIAATKSHGWEFSIEGDVIKNSKWQLTLNANGSTNKSFVTKFNNTAESYTSSYSKIELDQEIGQWYGYKTYNRLFGSAEEVTALKYRDETGVINNYRASYETDGDVYYEDINGDGKITTDDKTYLGSFIPKLFGGFGFNLYYGTSINIGATFTYSLGNKRYWYMAASDVNYTGNYNQSNKIAGKSAVLDYNSAYDPTTIPNATPYGYGSNGTFSDYWLYDASYIRLSTLNISYRLGKSVFGRSMIDNIDITFQAANLFTLTKYPGLDPQGNFSSSTSLTSNMGVDYSTYPASRNFTLGVKITFK